MNRTGFLFAGVVVVVLAVAQGFLMMREGDRAEAKPGAAAPGRRAMSDALPAFTEARAELFFAEVQGRSGNWAAAADLLAGEGMLGAAVLGPIEKDSAGEWRIRSAVNVHAMSGLYAAEMDLSEAAGRALVAQLSDDGAKNARVLAELALWADLGQADLGEADFAGLPAEIPVEDAFFFSERQPLNFGALPPAVMNRVVFRRCVLAGAQVSPRERMLVRMEGCLLQTPRFWSEAGAVWDLVLKDCIMTDGAFEGRVGVRTENCLLLKPRIQVDPLMWEQMTMEGTVVLNAVPIAPMPGGHDLVMAGPSTLMSARVAYLAAEKQARLVQIQALTEKNVAELAQWKAAQ